MRDATVEQANAEEQVDTVVIGGGQAGLSVGYHLARRGLPFVILDAEERVGDVWRRRWDSLRLFTPARFSSLDGMAFPAPPDSFPTKEEMGDYLEAYAARFDLPVRHATRVDHLTRVGDRYLVSAGDRRWDAANVVVAIGTFQRPKVPGFATELDPATVQLHSSEYRNPSQLRPGDVLLVGAGNSGSELAMELARDRTVWMAGRDTGHIPFRIDGWFGRAVGVRFVLRFLFRRVLTVRTPVGRRVRPKALTEGGPLIRVKPKDLAAAGVERVPRVEGVRDGRPVLTDGRVLDVANVVWCTGFHPGFSWIDLPVHGEHEPHHEAGIVPDHPGLYFVGLFFLSSMASEMIQGVGEDADRIAAHVAARVTTVQPPGRTVRSIAAKAPGSSTNPV
ncbi:flavin-containing monooxygenase [Nitriliruptor alkaliphilus]|uniref:flavin-containing monooxygenase n=1 Tax=Nitriliruptor alkaliphilus TaxID=427918 RepID=UPI0006978AD8|nr:NAD(P)-binding domain-containing protein [Nitriliruptor alkaliphilus]